jgi:hypothetical protein
MDSCLIVKNIPNPSELRGIGDGLIVRVAVISITGLVLTTNKASDW